MINFKINQKKEDFYDLIIETLMNFPRFGKVFLSEISNNKYLSNSEIEKILDITELLTQLKFPKILLESIIKAPLIPGSQHLVFSSIESLLRGQFIDFSFNMMRRIMLSIN